uniref:protein GAST1 n=1 Tax=Fragaria vesca subsp. vesca TaxID=101020 RepID=UPI0005CA906A|nr:PREDICTED: protein GAST1 [Fragaria vesca subsp. vesca]
MGRTPSLVMLALAMLLVLIGENRAAISSSIEAPSPQPQMRSNNQTMHGATEGSLEPHECGPRCSTRCSKTQYKKPCLFFCQKCCAKCLCVPPGTYGNKQVCPCYNNWKTKRGDPKCP